MSTPPPSNDYVLRTVTTAHARHFQAQQSELQKENERLHKKVKWYAENQELLDKDKHVIAAKDDEIKRLKVKVNALSSQVNDTQGVASV